MPDARAGGPWADRAKRFARSAALPFDARYFALIARAPAAACAALLTDEFRAAIDPGAAEAGYLRAIEPARGADPLHRALHADLALYLPGDLLPLADRVSMAHGLELRVPFLDHRLLEFAARIPAAHKIRRGETKHVLRRAVRDLVPAALLRRPKQGFSAPTQVWFRGPLREFVEDTLAPTPIRQGGVLRPGAVRALLDEHWRRRANHDDRIFALLTFVLWQRAYFGAAAA
ncbi:MAG: hypothetical protein DCC71_24350 [Proteobacteria bacterium]|nr:MAG: hypothetical protein DCC71_24350 [Pseudomonadota bacterium]